MDTLFTGGCPSTPRECTPRPFPAVDHSGFTDLDGTFSVVEVYDPATDSWSSKIPMPTSRGRLALVVIDKTIYAIGGNEGESAVEA